MKSSRAATLVSGGAGLMAIVVIWQLVISAGWVDARILPSPIQVLVALRSMLESGELYTNTVASLQRVLVGSAIAAVVGVIIGICIGANAHLARILGPVVEFLRPISPIAWIPLAIVWFGLGNGPAYFVIFVAAIFPIITNTQLGVQTIKINQLRAADMCGLKNWARIRMIVLPGAVPHIMVGIRVGVGIGWMAVIAAEFVGAQSGLGYLIEASRQLFNTPKILAGMVTIGVVGSVIIYILKKAEDIITPWA